MLDKMSVDFLTLILAIAGSFIAWLLADSKSKSRQGFLEEKFIALQSETDEVSSLYRAKVANLEVHHATINQDIGEIRRNTDRLESSKASKEVVDGIRQEISSLKIDMDKRFDKLERLIESQNK